MKRMTRMIITFLAGLLLEYFTTSQAYLIIGIVGFMIMLFVLNYMKNRVGLDPEEYDKKDIEYTK